MKVIIFGATGYVGSELMHQALLLPRIDTVVAVARRHIPEPDGSMPGKLRSVIVEDYGSYKDLARKEFKGAAACIWTIGITPEKSKTLDAEYVRKICLDDTLAGIQAVVDSSPSMPLRFLYMSGIGAERDLAKMPSYMPEFMHLRGRVEQALVDFATQHPGQVEVGVTRSGVIKSDVDPHGLRTVPRATALPTVELVGLATVLLNQAINGFKMELFENEDLVRLSEELLRLP